MGTADNIVLIGYRGTGKSTVGALLAEAVGRDFVDTDALIEQQQGRTIGEIFEQLGQDAFRDAEAQVVAQLTDVAPSVISIGAGAVERASNREIVRTLGTVICLTAAEDVLYRRLQADTRSASLRPALTPHDPRLELRAKLEERSSLYAELAAHTIDTTNHTPQQVLDAICELLASG